MQPITPEAKQYLQERMPQFVRAVRRATAGKYRHNPLFLNVTLDQFNEDVLLLHAALWYAGSNRVVVCVHPANGEEELLTA